jgi:hypothetical protein
MSSLNTEKIIQLAKEKTAEKEQQALSAIESLKGGGKKITFYSVAKETGLSKTFLYNNESVRKVIEDAREVALSTKDTDKEEGLKTEELLATIEQMKSGDPEGYKRIRAALLDINETED